MSRIFWDTNLFVYLFEDFGDLSKKVARLRERMIERGDQLFTSTLTLGEILVKPLESGDESLAHAYRQALAATAVLLPLDKETAVHFAAVRRDRSIQAPDAIQLACAAHARIDLFITNDDHLKGKIVHGVQFISSLEGAFF